MPTISLEDGRVLSYTECGDPNGVPVVFSHGFSDSRHIRNPDDKLTTALGVRWIAANQPGVGASTPHPGRRLRDWAADVEALANTLGLDEFVVAGHSGGGPHALAVAAFLPRRVTRVALTAPICQFDAGDFPSLMQSRLGAAAVRLPRLPLRWALRASGWWAHRDVQAWFKMAAGSDRTDKDTSTFTGEPDRVAMFMANFTEGFAQRGEGLVEMIEALRDWGFSYSDVKQHVDLFHGTLDAALKPEMGRRMVAALPHATLHVWANAGHYGFVDRERWAAFLSAMTGGQ